MSTSWELAAAGWLRHPEKKEIMGMGLFLVRKTWDMKQQLGNVETAKEYIVISS